MAETAQESKEVETNTNKKNEGNLEIKNFSPKDFLSQIDTGIYKQVLLFLGIAVIGATVFYLFLRVGQEASINRQKQPDKPQTATSEIDPELKEKITIDQTKKNDIAQINSALKSYFLENEKAPESLEELSPSILTEIPVDSETDKSYTYQPGENFESWTISATLTDGEVFEAKGP